VIRQSAIQIVLALSAVGVAGCRSCQSGERTPPPTPTVPPAAPTAASAAAPRGEEADCFVILDGEPDYGPPPLEVAFETEVDCTSSPLTYSWDFGDGTKGGNEANPTHVYEKPAEYVATVTVRAPDGGEGADDIDISVEADAE
jgi:hypothetical protein